jgi:hypothetical protein
MIYLVFYSLYSAMAGYMGYKFVFSYWNSFYVDKEYKLIHEKIIVKELVN